MSDAHINPEDYINYHASVKGITVAEIGVAPLVVVSWRGSVIKSLAEKCGAVAQEHWVYGADKLFTSEADGQRVSFAHIRVGAATAVMEMEELIACGARTFLALGWTGSLQGDLPVGSLVIADSCIREEGTSAHYVAPEVSLRADPYLKTQLQESINALGLQATTGTVWSIDAPYRELKSKVNKYRAMGALGVEMETSAIYALGQFRNVRVCNLLVVSDEIREKWKPAFYSAELDAANKKAEDVLIECVKRIAT